VGKSTHAGIPWLRFIRQRLGSRVHFWPFDGWDIPAGRSAIAEVYPALWSPTFDREDRTADQHDAYCVAARLSRADHNGTLVPFLKPELTPAERILAVRWRGGYWAFRAAPKATAGSYRCRNRCRDGRDVRLSVGRSGRI
jgi:hypothetical protein